MRILVTRPAEDGEETAGLLTARGHQPLVAPLLSTHFWDGPEVSLQGVQAILATSANGVRALARRVTRRDVALFAVGPQTAAQARMMGFESVKSADGDAAALAEATKIWARPDKGALLHVAGEGNDGKLVHLLAGFTIRKELLYAVKAAQKMPETAARALALAQVDVAMFYSPRSASVFRDLVQQERLPVESLTAACISQAAAAALAPLCLRAVRVAAQPNQRSLFEVLD
jgi:uroporphyrinogen-III synthase